MIKANAWYGYYWGFLSGTILSIKLLLYDKSDIILFVLMLSYTTIAWIGYKSSLSDLDELTEVN